MRHEPPTHIRPLARPLTLHAPGMTCGVVLVHGFGDAPYSMRDLASFLFRHGYSVAVPRLPGHGSRLEHLAAATTADWQRAVTRALAGMRARVRRVAIVGRSFGGVLALLELLRDPGGADALVMMATPSRIHGQRPIEFVLPFVGLVKKTVKKPWLRSADYVERLEVGRYDRLPVKTIREFFRTLRLLRDGRLQRVTTPTLFIHGQRDELAHPASVDFFCAHLGSVVKEVLLLKDATHAASSLHRHHEVQKRLLAFLTTHLGES
ncbi:MAG: alpha/beta fold hydrolase [Candidatus Kerfeldbacteria bacterium]|nr:alpha/beta fold hydrolase [Candidatus Kerfeldbacteria bacterium]